jgi:hypothetical protein
MANPEHGDLASFVRKAFADGLKQLGENFVALREGRGAPADLVDQVVTLAECLLVFNEVYGHRPTPELIRDVMTNRRDDLETASEPKS